MSAFPVVLVKRLSAKTGKLYAALYFDLGYRLLLISFDRATIAEVLDLTVPQYEDLVDGLVVDERRVVAHVEPVKK